MNIRIVTVYHPFTNLGSFLQAFALQNLLTNLGHNVSFLKTGPHISSAIKLITHINPKREFFLRFKKAFYALSDLSKIKTIMCNKDDDADLLIFGSDEIWNVTNEFFQQPIFWGVPFKGTPMIGYAVSVGHAEERDFIKHFSLTSNLNKISLVFSRDLHTQKILKNVFDIPSKLVLDPTLLINVSALSKPIKLPKEKYILVYTYGLSQPMISIIQQFAKKRRLQIISPCFWHSWTDKTIECSALQFSSLIKGAEYIFTSTFHGAIFSLINHTKCCILPVREKVKAVCEVLKCEDRLVTEDVTYEAFEHTIEQIFPVQMFEENLIKLRNESIDRLNDAIKKYTK